MQNTQLFLVYFKTSVKQKKIEQALRFPPGFFKSVGGLQQGHASL